MTWAPRCRTDPVKELETASRTTSPEPKRHYQVIYRAKDGRQTSESFVRRKDADRRKSEVEVDLRNWTYIEPREGRTTFGTWYDRWEPIRQVSPRRRTNDAGLAKKHVLARGERVPLDAITHMEAQAWVGTLSKKLAPASVASRFGLLKMPLDAAVLEGKLRANPVLSVKLPTIRRPKITADGVLTADALRKLLSVITVHRATPATGQVPMTRRCNAVARRVRRSNVDGALHAVFSYG
jgi:hypothetical protein